MVYNVTMMKEANKRVTRKQVENKLHSLGFHDVEMHHDRNLAYAYFTGGICDLWGEQAVWCVNTISQNSVDEWVSDFTHLLEKNSM